MEAIDRPDFAEKIRSRNPEAIKTVVHKYLPQILRAARGAGLDEHRAEDITQDTFTTFIEKAESFDGRSHVRTWLFGILYKKILEAHRDTKKSMLFENVDEIMEERFKPDGTWMHPPEKADARLYETEIRKYLEECLENIPYQQRLAFFMREVEGQTTKEICNIMEITRTNLGVLLYRCRNLLRECLEEKGITGSKSD